MELFARNPERTFTIREVELFLQSWAGVVYGDLVTLQRRGHLHVDKDARGMLLYWYNEDSDFLPPGLYRDPDTVQCRPVEGGRR